MVPQPYGSALPRQLSGKHARHAGESVFNTVLLQLQLQLQGALAQARLRKAHFPDGCLGGFDALDGRGCPPRIFNDFLAL